MANPLNVDVYYGTLPPWANSTIITSDHSAVLIDAQLMKTDARAVAERIKEIGKPLKAIFVTHFHPDHVWGGAELLEHFPDVKIYARPDVKQDIDMDFHARMLRWTGWFNVGPFEGEIPERPIPIEAFEADSYDLDGQEITLIDLGPAETVNATAFYLPDSRTYIAGDHLYNKCHYYVGAGLNRPDLWIKSLDDVRSTYDIERIIPGHGYVGGTEIIDEAVEYLRFYEELYTPYMPQEQIVEAMLGRYPEWGLEGVLYMTIGPAVTSPEILKQTGGHVNFGQAPIAEGSYRG